MMGMWWHTCMASFTTSKGSERPHRGPVAIRTSADMASPPPALAPGISADLASRKCADVAARVSADVAWGVCADVAARVSAVLAASVAADVACGS
jgi:hypothetical protein